MRSKVAQRILAETPEETKIFARLYADIVVRVNQLLKAKGFSQKDLADKLEKRPSEINKWLIGEHNFTLRSLAKLEAELGETIINVPHRKPISSSVGTRTYVTVYKNAHINTDVEYTNVWKKSNAKSKTHLANVS
ncbi:multiprotein-bridging factor 1 family protein [Flavobacterium sp. LB2P53]|jgi:transcriptional regulator with XRE-family HTH domain|uniref:helix-turn-helix domain-containing protein n=1 Tax=Flavobacterium sp. LB2P53 TaxID=2497481 RepID=UPI000F8247F5|nr:helix-turn-helix transcriptional regulator [Flavobacterium sp. LB2P53]RTY67074.1 XRE family transcriptional regulator [Flavobacterium sp. LB2P53]